MENASFQIRDYLKPGCHAHLVGIGGVSMRPLGLVLRSMGMQISGSDMNASVSTDELISKGIDVAIGHRAENIAGADCVIRTAAANNDNPEIAAARAAGIPIFERAQAWGYIMRACGITTRPPGCWPVVRLTSTQPDASRFSSALLTVISRSERYFLT